MSNSKNGKMYIGIIVTLLTSLIGGIVWIFAQDSVKMSKDSKSMATAFFFSVIAPAVIFYVIWYIKGVKALASATDKIPSFVPFLAISAVIVIALTVGTSIALYDKAIIYAAITAGASIIGSVISYFALQP